MYWQGATALLLGASAYLPQAAAQVITITAYPSTCSAIYTTGSRSVTVVQSTVTVSPALWNDNSANTGSAFVLQALPDVSGTKKRQAAALRWVLPNGYLTTDGMKAAQYMIQNNQLTEKSGGWVSTFEDIPYGTFAVSTIVGNINTTFTVTDGKLVWSNGKFTNGAAKLFQKPEGGSDPAHVVVRFYGAINSNWIPYSLFARPVNAATEGTSPMPSMPSTAIVSSIGDGMSSMQPTASSSGNGMRSNYSQQPTSTSGSGNPPPASSGGGGVVSSRGSETSIMTRSQGSPPSSSAAQSSPAAPTSSLPTSPDGICGGDTGFHCADHQCCGQYNYCGRDELYCGAGCQPDVGPCWTTSMSSMAMTSTSMPGSSAPASSYVPTSYPPSISIPSSIRPPASSSVLSMSMNMSTSPPASSPAASSPMASSSMTSMSMSMYMSPSASMPMDSTSTMPDTSPESSVYQPQPTYAICPADNGHIITDVNEQQYTIGCGKDTTINMYASQLVSRDFNECFNFCDQMNDCIAFTYLGGTNGVGPGICYFKNAMVEFVESGNAEHLISGILFMDMEDRASSSSVVPATTLTAPTMSTKSTYTATATPIGPDHPGGPPVLSSSSSSSAMSSSMSSSMPMSSSTSMSMSMTSRSSASGGTSISISLSSGRSPASSSSMSMGTSSSTSTSRSVSTSLSPSSSMSMSLSTSIPMYMPVVSSTSISSSRSTSRSASITSSLSSMMPSATHPVSPNGHCGVQGNGGTTDGFTCANSLFGDCCSYSGFCGYSSDYCLAGCQNEYGTCSPGDGHPITASGECGPDWSNTTCTGGIFGPCCSTSGFCGSDDDYCAYYNCDPEYGTCNPNDGTYTPPTTTTTTTTTPAITTTTTRTTTSTTSTSSSTSSTPYLVLPSPTPCDFGDPANYDEDDSYCKITLPFQMRIYDKSDANTFASTNGYLSLSYGSSQFASLQFPTANIPNNTVAPFLDDLYMHGVSSPKEGIFYQIQGTVVTYEWYVGRAGTAGQICHFTVRYDSGSPGVFTITYYSTGGPDDQGEYATVGTQGKNGAGTPIGVTYAYHVQQIPPGLVVVCDTNANTCETQT